VKNLNTTAIHQLLEVLELLRSEGEQEEEEEEEEEEAEELAATESAAAALARDAKARGRAAGATSRSPSTKYGIIAAHVRQSIAIMSCAAHLTYQQSRIGGILRGEAPLLTEPLGMVTQTWQRICGPGRFRASATACRLLVDRFRVVAVLSNAWGNALAHGDSARLGEVEICLRAVPPNLVEIRVSNWSRHDDESFDGVEGRRGTAETPVASWVRPFQDVVEGDEQDQMYDDDDDEEEGEGEEGEEEEWQKEKKKEQQKEERRRRPTSPQASLTTQMGIAWMQRLCSDGRLSLCSEGHGGRTVLTCMLPADHSPLRQNRDNCSPTTGFTAAERDAPLLHSLRDSSRLPPLPHRTSPSCMRAAHAENGGAAAATTTTTSTSTMLARHDWDVRLAKALLEEHGMVVVEDSRVLALQIQHGLRRTHGVGAGRRTRPSPGHRDSVVRVLCGVKASRMREIQALERGAATEQAMLVCFDRNLGYGTDARTGRRAAMPHGDAVAARMRQRGYAGCTFLQTGGSCAEVEALERRYARYYIDRILGKQRLAMAGDKVRASEQNGFFFFFFSLLSSFFLVRHTHWGLTFLVVSSSPAASTSPRVPPAPAALAAAAVAGPRRALIPPRCARSTRTCFTHLPSGCARGSRSARGWTGWRAWAAPGQRRTQHLCAAAAAATAAAAAPRAAAE
jgi:hypothetical protein